MYSMIKNYKGNKIGQISHLPSKSTFKIRQVVDRSPVIKVVFLFAFAFYVKRFSRILYHFHNIARASIRVLRHSFSHKLVDSSAIFKNYTNNIIENQGNEKGVFIIDFDHVLQVEIKLVSRIRKLEYFHFTGVEV